MKEHLTHLDLFTEGRGAVEALFAERRVLLIFSVLSRISRIMDEGDDITHHNMDLKGTYYVKHKSMQ